MCIRDSNKRFTADQVPVAHWSLLTTLTDFSHPGDIDVFIDEASIGALEELMDQKGYLDGSEMASSFRMLRSNSLIWHYWVRSYLMGEPLPPIDVLFWNMDTTRMPRAMHSVSYTHLVFRDAGPVGQGTAACCVLAAQMAQHGGADQLFLAQPGGHGAFRGDQWRESRPWFRELHARREGPQYPDAVSYTHLDVYKRQRRHSSVIHGSISLACVSTERAPWINSGRR